MEENLMGDFFGYSVISTTFKVHIFWEGHKILRNLHLTFGCKYVTNLDKSKVKISQSFMAFSEYMNFNSPNILSL